MPSPRSLDGAHIVVVGVTGVLGSHLASALQGRGAVVTGVAREADRAHGLGLTGSILEGDLTDATLGDRLAELVRERHGGRLDGVVNAAGVVAFGPLEQTPDDVIEHLFLTDVIGPLWLARRVTPLLRESRGFLAQISGLVAARPTASMAAYSAAKAALAAAGAALATELRRDGITVLDLQPPHTETGLVDRALSGTPPRLPDGLTPDRVAERIVCAIEQGERLVEAAAF